MSNFKVGDIVWCKYDEFPITGYHVKCVVVRTYKNNDRIVDVKTLSGKGPYAIPTSDFERVCCRWSDV